jgi:hypothetical protein
MNSIPYKDRWWAVFVFVFLLPIWILVAAGEVYRKFLEELWEFNSKK